MPLCTRDSAPREEGARLDFAAALRLFARNRTMLGRANASRVFLQTSTPDAVSLFEQWAEAHSWKLSYTSNARSRNDLWVVGSGKHTTNHSGEQISVVAQTVNALVASRSRHFLSPSSSMWTWFIRALMGRKVSDTINDVGGEIFEECVAALQRRRSIRKDRTRAWRM